MNDGTDDCMTAELKHFTDRVVEYLEDLDSRMAAMEKVMKDLLEKYRLGQELNDRIHASVSLQALRGKK